MEMMAYENYILHNPDRKQLKKHKFHYNKEISDSDSNFYSIRFPVLKYNKATTVDGEIIIDMDTGGVKLNAYNYATKYCYPPFYQNNCSEVYEPIMEKINKEFQKMFNKVGIKKVS